MIIDGCPSERLSVRRRPAALRRRFDVDKLNRRDVGDQGSNQLSRAGLAVPYQAPPAAAAAAAVTVDAGPSHGRHACYRAGAITQPVVVRDAGASTAADAACTPRFIISPDLSSDLQRPPRRRQPVIFCCRNINENNNKSGASVAPTGAGITDRQMAATEFKPCSQ